jgi:hypothetical protein
LITYTILLRFEYYTISIHYTCDILLGNRESIACTNE